MSLGASGGGGPGSSRGGAFGDGAAGRRRQVVAATLTYDNFDDLDNLDNRDVRAALDDLVSALESQGFTTGASAETGPKWREVTRLRSLMGQAREAARDSDWLVFYYTGHGASLDGSFVLVSKESCVEDLDDEGLRPADLARQLLTKAVDGQRMPPEQQPHVLLIIDACFAGAAAVDVALDAVRGIGNPRLHLITSTSSVEEALAGAFPKALARVIGPYDEARGTPPQGRAAEFIAWDELVGIINHDRELGEASYFQPYRVTGAVRFFRNPAYVPGVAGLKLADQKWWAKARGIHLPKEAQPRGLYLAGRTGRRKALDRIAEWLKGEGADLQVVTGWAGAGKSALLSLPVLLNGIEDRQALVQGADDSSLLAYAADPRVLPPTVERLKGMQVGGLTADQVAEQVADWLGAPVNELDQSANERLRRHLKGLEPGWAFLIIDGVDEAREGARVIRLAREIAESGAVRVLVGTRPRMLRSAPVAAVDVIDLDAEEYKDPEALLDYASQVLRADLEREGTWFGHATAGAVEAAAQRIREWATDDQARESFLLAGSIAQGMRNKPWHEGSSPWADGRPDIAAIFEDNLDSFGDDRPLLKHLLAALAWARGPGLPRQGVWLPIAQCLASVEGLDGTQIEGKHVQDVLERFGGYTIEDVDADWSSVYRPFHDLFAAYLQDRPSDDRIETDGEWQKHRRKVNAAIVDALVGSISRGGEPDWLQAPEYVRRYLAQHAVDAGTETFADIDFLAVADPVVLTPLLSPAAKDPRVAAVGRVYRKARHSLGTDPVTNALRLSEAQLEVLGTPPASRMSLPYHPIINAPTLPDDSVLTLAGHTDDVFAVTAWSQRDGRVLVASGSDDRTIRLWDANTGEQVGPAMVGHTGWVRGITTVLFSDGRVYLASGGSDGTVRIWNPESAEQIGQPLVGHTGAISVVDSAVLRDGRVLIVSGGSDCTVRLWDADSGAQFGTSLTGHTGQVEALAVLAGQDGRVVVASAGLDGSVRLWDPDTGSQLFALDGHIGWVHALVSVAMPDGGHRLVSGGADGSLQFWDPDSGELIAHLNSGHRGQVLALEVAIAPDGLALIASGGVDGRVRLWDPTAQQQVGRAMTGGHGRWPIVNDLAAVTDPNGTAILVSGSPDGLVQLRAMQTASEVGKRRWGHTEPVWALASIKLQDGVTVLASSGNDDSVRLWSLTTGEPFGKALIGHTNDVWALASLELSDGRTQVASGSNDGTVRLWNPFTGVCERVLQVGHSELVFALCSVTLTSGRVLLASGGSEGRVRLWDPNTGKQVGEDMVMHSAPVWALAELTLPDASVVLASGGDDGTVTLWDPDTGLPRGKSFTSDTGGVRALAFVTLPDGRVLLACGSQFDGPLRLWNALTGIQVGDPLLGQDRQVLGLETLPLADGRTLLAASGEEGLVRLWDASTGEQVGEPITAHAGPVRALASVTLPDGRSVLASAGDDRLLVVALNL